MNAEDYLKHWEKIKGWTHYSWPKHQKRFMRLALKCEGKSCIDVGCGYGQSTKLLNGLYKAKWTGLEYSSDAVKKARKNFPKIEFIYASSYDLEKECGGRLFDTVICSEVIEHIKDDKAFIKELMKITGKKLILTTPNRFVDDPGHLRIYNGEIFEEMLNEYNFTVESTNGFYFVEIRK